jgi:hypothetical protein
MDVPGHALAQTAPPSSVPFLSKSRNLLGGSISSISSVSSASSEYPDEEVEIEEQLFLAIDDGNRDALRELFEGSPRTLEILLQILLTRSYTDRKIKDGKYNFDPEDVGLAEAFLGSSLAQLNGLQMAIMNDEAEEELALDLLDYFFRATETLGGRKALLHEFLAHQFGNGNTSLHLAAFMGMEQVCRRLLELGASLTRANSRGLRPLDCTLAPGVKELFLHFNKLGAFRLRRVFPS